MIWQTSRSSRNKSCNGIGRLLRHLEFHSSSWCHFQFRFLTEGILKRIEREKVIYNNINENTYESLEDMPLNQPKWKKQLYMTLKKELEQQKHSEKEWGAKCPLFLLSNPKTTRKNVIKGSSDCHYPRRPQTHHETSVTNYQVSYLGQTAETWTQDRVNTSEWREITLPNTIDLRNTLLNGTQHNFIYITNDPNGTTKN